MKIVCGLIITLTLLSCGGRSAHLQDSWKLSQETGIPLYNHQGGVCAAPVFRRIAWNAMKYLEIHPDRPEELPEDMDIAEYEHKIMELE